MEEETTKHAGGRPLKFQSVEELDRKIDEYFESRAPHVSKILVKKLKADGGHYWAEDEELTEQRPVHMSGLAAHLGTDRRTLLNYKDRPEFFPSIANALVRCEEYSADTLWGPYANGAKFSLTNNHGWEDKTIRENKGGLFDSGKLEVEVVNTPTEATNEDETPEAEPDSGSSTPAA